LIEFEFCEDTMSEPQFQKAKLKAQHSVLISNLHRQGYREVKLHVIFVGVMGSIFTKTIQTNLWQTLIWITIRKTMQAVKTTPHIN